MVHTFIQNLYRNCYIMIVYVGIIIILIKISRYFNHVFQKLLL